MSEPLPVGQDVKDIQRADRGLVHRQDPEVFRAGAGRGGPGELMGQGPPTGAPAEAARYGIFAVDDDGVIRAWNGGAADLLGWREDLALGHRLGEILAPPAFLGTRQGTARSSRRLSPTIARGPLLCGGETAPR